MFICGETGMKFIENVFVSGIDDMETVIYSFKKGIAVFNIYLVAVSENNNGIIMSSCEFFKNENYKDMYIAAICSGKYNAYRTYTSIVEYAMKNKWNINEIGKKLIEEKA